MTRKANMPCPCGSYKPYKHCCRQKDKALKNIWDLGQAGKLHPSVSIKSDNSSESGTLTVSCIKANETIFLDNEITLNTNSIKGDVSEKSSATLSFPMQSTSKVNGTIKTIGNATVFLSENSSSLPEIKLANNAKKLSEKSTSGLFVTAKIGLQKNTGIEYFDIFFGEKGRSENIGENGQKDRPHIAFHPDGNGKFIRLASYNCELESDMQYNSNSRQIVPKKIQIKATDFSETIEITFSQANSHTVILESINFVNHH
jgi:SEC-C motif